MTAQLRWTLMVALLGGVLALRPGSTASDWTPRGPRVPQSLAPYRGTDLAVPEHWCSILETSDILLRDYAQGREPPVTLCLVFSSRSRKVAHPPEVCYSGQGFEIADRAVVRVGPRERIREVVALTVGRDGDMQRVFAFYRSGESETCSFVEQQLRMMRDALFGRPLAAAFIRVSTPLVGDVASADRRLARFLKRFTPALEVALR